jgi:hypothetical protein
MVAKAAGEDHGDRLAGRVPARLPRRGVVAECERQPGHPLVAGVGEHDPLGVTGLAGRGHGHEDPVGGLEHLDGAHGDEAGVPGPDTHAGQPPRHRGGHARTASRDRAAAATNRAATAGVAAQWVWR